MTPHRVLDLRRQRTCPSGSLAATRAAWGCRRGGSTTFPAGPE